VLGYLRERGVPEEAVSRVRAPAGLDLGKVAHEEIAVTIAAEIVALRASGEIPAGSRTAVPREPAVDPVCGMTVDPGTTPHRVELGDRTCWFCSAACRDSFEAEPDRHLSRDSTAGRS